MYSVKEISEILNVSKVTIYNDLKRFKSELKPYLTTRNKVKYLSQDGLDKLSSLKQLNSEVKTDFNHTLNDDIEIELRERLNDSKEELKFLKGQLEIGQKQLENSQRLHEHTQILLKQSQEKNMLLESQKNEKEVADHEENNSDVVIHQEEKTGWFKGIFEKMKT
jgi:transposase